MLCFKSQQYTMHEEFDFFECTGTHNSKCARLILVNMVKCFKFQQNCIINEEFNFFEEEGGELFLISCILGKHMKTICFKFHQNHIKKEEFAFFKEGGKGKWTPIFKF